MRVALLVVFAVVAGGVAGAEPPQGDVDAAVRRGVAWLRKEQKANGAFGANAGETALGLLALRHSGVPASDRACMRAGRQLERTLPDGSVYGAALGVLALLAQDAKRRHRDKIETLVAHLVGGQCRNGQWTYRYRATARKPAGDNSNTQLAVLALAAAHARGIEVPRECFQRTRGFLLATQNEDGGFGYAHNQRKRSYGSMTAGGAMALALCAAVEERGRFGDPGLAQGRGARRAIDWLARDFSPAANRDAARAFGAHRGKRGDSFWKHYWLWSLERAMAAVGAEKLGRHDWYAEGARHLLDTQRKDGSWRDPERELQATCFALLFLTRSTRAVLTPRDRVVVTTPR